LRDPSRFDALSPEACDNFDGIGNLIVMIAG
jgi:hypothetical protein